MPTSHNFDYIGYVWPAHYVPQGPCGTHTYSAQLSSWGTVPARNLHGWQKGVPPVGNYRMRACAFCAGCCHCVPRRRPIVHHMLLCTQCLTAVELWGCWDLHYVRVALALSCWSKVGICVRKHDVLHTSMRSGTACQQAVAADGLPCQLTGCWAGRVEDAMHSALCTMLHSCELPVESRS
jgi:hypothetical protein